MICISCQNDHSKKYCPNCGESAGTEKITLATIFGGAFSTITNMDKGFLFNIKWLFLNPKKITEDYINGKRNNIYNPISFLIICVTIYILLETLFKIPTKLNLPPTDDARSLGLAIGKVSGQLLRLKYFILLTIFVLGSSIKLVFKKNNYWENVAISAFVLGISALVSITLHPITRLPLLMNPILYISIGIIIFRIFKQTNRLLRSFFLSFLALLLFIVQLIVLVLTTAILYNIGSLVTQLSQV